MLLQSFLDISALQQKGIVIQNQILLPNSGRVEVIRNKFKYN